ncbi:PIN domain-containing protein [Microbacterium sp.]|uniref:PIN domain-containing protein n=1 Tax=Microbacterium sp. TaxID=51671 RepID=UPI003C76FB97
MAAHRPPRSGRLAHRRSGADPRLPDLDRGQGLLIWSEDKDFFGAGIPTWTSDLVEIYLRDDRQTDATARPDGQ